MTRQKVPLFPILLVNFIGTLGFSIVLPFLIFLVTKFGGNAFVYGVMGSMYPAFQLIGAPILGRWSDHHGRKRILLLSQIGTAVAWIIFLAALFLPVKEIANVNSPLIGTFIITVPLIILFAARALDGITGGNIAVAQAYLADITTEKERNKNYGRMGMSSNLGFIIGPALAAILGATILGEILPVIAALIISLAAIAIIAVYLPESKKHTYPEEPQLEKKKEWYNMNAPTKLKIRDVVKLPGIPFILILYFLIFLGFHIFYSAFPIHAIAGLHWNITQMGIFFSALSVMMFIVQGPVLSKATKVYSDNTLAIAGSVILGTNFVLLLSQQTEIIYLAAVFFALGNGIMWPSFLSILSKKAGEKNQGAVQGVASSAGGIASIIGLILGGFVYGFLGARTFILPAVVIYLVFVLLFLFTSRNTTTKENFE